jgi:hypothetical protein
LPIRAVRSDAEISAIKVDDQSMAQRVGRAMSMRLNSNASKNDRFAKTMPNDRATATSNHECAA